MAQVLLYVFQANTFFQKKLANGVSQTVSRHSHSFQAMLPELLIDNVPDLVCLQVIK